MQVHLTSGEKEKGEGEREKGVFKVKQKKSGQIASIIIQS